MKLLQILLVCAVAFFVSGCSEKKLEPPQRIVTVEMGDEEILKRAAAIKKKEAAEAKVVADAKAAEKKLFDEAVLKAAKEMREEDMARHAAEKNAEKVLRAIFKLFEAPPKEKAKVERLPDPPPPPRDESPKKAYVSPTAQEIAQVTRFHGSFAGYLRNLEWLKKGVEDAITAKKKLVAIKEAQIVAREKGIEDLKTESIRARLPKDEVYGLIANAPRENRILASEVLTLRWEIANLFIHRGQAIEEMQRVEEFLRRQEASLPYLSKRGRP